MEIYQVGGSVRDKLLNIPVNDHDWVVVGATPQQLIAQGYQQVGKDFPVFLHPHTHEEYALARTEKKSGRGHIGFTCYFSPDVTLLEDLQRRDLTINAIAQDQHGRLIDPFHGQDDLQQRILRHVSPAFIEDPLRVLRVARFAAKFHGLKFTVAPETLALMTDLVSNGELATLPAERVWRETEKSLATDYPQIYFKILLQCNALSVLYPQIAKLFDQYENSTNLGTHALATLTSIVPLTQEAALRFAAVCHDVTKVNTGNKPLKQWINQFSNQQKLPSHVAELIYLVSRYYPIAFQLESMDAKQLIDCFNEIDVWRKPERLAQIITCSIADRNSRFHQQQTTYPETTQLWQSFQHANNVDVQTIIQDGFSGSAIRQELNRRRIATINKR